MNRNDCASIIAFARLLGAQGTDEEIFNAFVEYYINAQTSLKQYKMPKGLKKKKFKFPIEFQGQDIAEMVIFLGLFVFLAVILLPATK